MKFDNDSFNAQLSAMTNRKTVKSAVNLDILLHEHKKSAYIAMTTKLGMVL